MKLFHARNYDACKNNLATEKELAKTKITTGNLSTELKSKFHVQSNFLKSNFLKFIYFFCLDCVVNLDRLSQELKVAEENLKKDFRSKNYFVYDLKFI